MPAYLVQETYLCSVRLSLPGRSMSATLPATCVSAWSRGAGRSATSDEPGAPPPTRPAPVLVPLALMLLDRSIVVRALARAGEAPDV
jgi:hypothetical protein